ncbi:hypothetical protein F5887DRAFT_124345 [Amanita rubescens]|nr:hypothetical protein F5887DRAFT_124345 [Amanita rubescens]
MATYLIKSIQTQRLVTTLGNEEAGDPVNTYFGSTMLTFSKALDGSETLTTIKGDSGLYISPGPDEKILIWSEAEFIWNAVLTNATESYYELIPANGQDLYWTQDTNDADEYYVSIRRNKGTQKLTFNDKINLLPGSQVAGDEGIWKIYND